MPKSIVGYNPQGDPIVVIVLNSLGGIKLAAMSQLQPFGLMNCDTFSITDFLTMNDAEKSAMIIVRNRAMIIWPTFLVKLEGFD